MYRGLIPLQTVAPELPRGVDAQKAVDVCIEVGACLMPEVIDSVPLFEAVKELATDDDPEFANPEFSRKIMEMAGSFDMLVAINGAMTAKNIPNINSAAVTGFDNGVDTPVHIDKIPSGGISLLVPLVHNGVFRLHKDPPAGILPPDGEVEYRALYGPDSILLVRQAMPERNLSAKYHAGITRFQPDVDYPVRLMVGFDYVESEH